MLNEWFEEESFCEEINKVKLDSVSREKLEKMNQMQQKYEIIFNLILAHIRIHTFNHHWKKGFVINIFHQEDYYQDLMEYSRCEISDAITWFHGQQGRCRHEWYTDEDNERRAILVIESDGYCCN